MIDVKSKGEVDAMQQRLFIKQRNTMVIFENRFGRRVTIDEYNAKKFVRNNEGTILEVLEGIPRKVTREQFEAIKPKLVNKKALTPGEILLGVDPEIKAKMLEEGEAQGEDMATVAAREEKTRTKAKVTAKKKAKKLIEAEAVEVEEEIEAAREEETPTPEVETPSEPEVEEVKAPSTPKRVVKVKGN